MSPPSHWQSCLPKSNANIHFPLAFSYYYNFNFKHPEYIIIINYYVKSLELNLKRIVEIILHKRVVGIKENAF